MSGAALEEKQVTLILPVWYTRGLLRRAGLTPLFVGFSVATNLLILTRTGTSTCRGVVCHTGSVQKLLLPAAILRAEGIARRRAHFLGVLRVARCLGMAEAGTSGCGKA
jgi:hypothetical protein